MIVKPGLFFHIEKHFISQNKTTDRKYQDSYYSQINIDRWTNSINHCTA